ICLVYVILSYTSICLTILQVVHGKHHRIERTKRCATGAGRTASLPCLALSLLPAQPPGLTKQDRGRAGLQLYLSYSFAVLWSISKCDVSYAKITADCIRSIACCYLVAL